MTETTTKSTTPSRPAQLIWSGAPEDDIGREWPAGWRKEMYSRGGDNSKARDSYWFTPQNSYKLRSLPDVKRFLQALDQCGNQEEVAILATVQYKAKKPGKRGSSTSTPEATATKKQKTSRTKVKKKQEEEHVAAPTASIFPPPPQEPRSAFEFFCAELRPTLDVPNQEMKLQEMWGGLLQEVQDTYQKKAVDDRLRYWSELEEYATQQKKEVQGCVEAGKPLPPFGGAPSVSLPPPATTVTTYTKKGATLKDKNAPKKNVSAYNFFFKLERQKIFDLLRNPSVNNIPDTPGYIDSEWMEKLVTEEGKPKVEEVTRLAVQRWKTITAEERAPYDAMAEQDAQRYRQELEAYQSGSYAPPPTATTSTKTGPGGRRKRDPRAPKKHLAAYNFFFQAEQGKLLAAARGEAADADLTPEELASLRLEHGKVNVQQVSRLVGQRWKNVSTEQLEHYNQLAAQDAERYKKEMEAYEQQQEQTMEDAKPAATEEKEEAPEEPTQETTNAEPWLPDGTMLNLAV
jgi:hypothetical protein